MTHDLIGDIHGHADELKALLSILGYVEQGGVWRHPEPDRKAVFVGDFIDRGSQNFEVLRVVRAMWEAGSALAVLGNHEFNALCYHTSDGKGGFLRSQNDKNKKQHAETLLEIEAREGEWIGYLDWMRRLPLFLGLEHLRVVHACWDPGMMAVLGRYTIRDERGRLTDDFLRMASQKGHELYEAVEVLLKGPEFRLPEGKSFKDKDGIERHQVRSKWWALENGRDNLHTWGDISQIEDVEIAQLPLAPEFKNNLPRYGNDSDPRPIFFGHYWFDGKSDPRILTATAACLDYSVADGGRLAAYTHRAGSPLSSESFQWVRTRQSRG